MSPAVVAGHGDSQPAGSQDTIMLDDSMLAWGQATEPKDGGRLTVVGTQALPGVGPMDDGSVVALAADSCRWCDRVAGHPPQ